MEELETRSLMSAGAWSSLTPLLEIEPNNTLDLAQNLGYLNTASPIAVVGNVGNSPAGAADVDWFQFSLTHPAQLKLDAHTPAGGSLVSVLSLYNNDPWNFNDPEDTIGHRLLDQAVGNPEASDTVLTQPLAAGTYWVAVSGAGNQWFDPFIADSGFPGSTGDYELSLGVSKLAVSRTSTSPVLLYSTPPSGSVINAPLVVRLDYSTALDPNIDLSATLLIYSPDGNFTDPSTQPVPLASCYFSTAANELQLIPAAPLEPGYYRVLAVSPDTTSPALQFQVAGSEGRSSADDTAASAHALGDLTSAGPVHVTGAIGDDPAYNPNNCDPLLSNPSSDVDMYQFQISGPGQYAFAASVFAGRIGSSLDPGVSLFRWNPDTQQLDFIDGNDNTLNSTLSTNGMLPLYTDSALFAGLTAGDYYVAVSAHGNTPERALDLLPGEGGIFDPNLGTHSGTNGSTVGDYVLNLTVQTDNVPPQVVAVTPQNSTTLDAPPTQLTVQFSKSVNLQLLAYQAFQQASQFTVGPVFVEGADGTRYFPRFESYDDSTHQATFLMLDGLANGDYQLHLSGSLGLADLAGNALVGNGDPSGDYVVSFTVAGPDRGPSIVSRETSSQPQNIGVLFPNELQTGVSIVRDFSVDPATNSGDSADSFQFQVLQNRPYTFILSGEDLPAGANLQLFDTSGNPVPATVVQNGEVLETQPDPGTYLVSVSWTPGSTISGSYQLTISQGADPDNPPPLTVGPCPSSMTTFITRDPLPPPPVVSGNSASTLVTVLPPPLRETADPPMLRLSGAPTDAASSPFLAVNFPVDALSTFTTSEGYTSPAVFAAPSTVPPWVVTLPSDVLANLAAEPMNGTSSGRGNDTSPQSELAKQDTHIPDPRLMNVSQPDRRSIVQRKANSDFLTRSQDSSSPGAEELDRRASQAPVEESTGQETANSEHLALSSVSSPSSIGFDLKTLSLILISVTGLTARFACSFKKPDFARPGPSQDRKQPS